MTNQEALGEAVAAIKLTQANEKLDKPTKTKTKTKSKKQKNNKNKTVRKQLAKVPGPKSVVPAFRSVRRDRGVTAFVKKVLSPSVPRATVLSKRSFDLRDRVVRRNLSVAVMQVFRHSPRARSLVKDLLSGVYTGATASDRGLCLFALEHETEPLAADGYAESAAKELHPQEHKKEIRPAKVRNVLSKLEDDMVHDELESNAVGHLYLNSLLMPCSAPNPGIPDEENRALSMKLRVRTVYLLPMTNDEAYVIISRNPVRHIQIMDVGGSGSYTGPLLEMVTTSATSNYPWYDALGKEVVKTASYSQANASSTFPVSNGYDRKLADDEFTNADGDTLDLVSVAYSENGKISVAKVLPCAAGDTVVVRGYTSDTASGNIKTFAWFLTKTGSADPILSQQFSSALTGSGSVNVFAFSGSVTAPANTIGVVSYGVQNQGSAITSTVYPKVQAALTLASSPVYFPIGSSDLEDLNLLANEANDVRVVGCRATLTYVAKKLEGGYIVGGQLPEAGDDDIPQGALSQLAVIPGMVPRPLNGITPGISFPIFALNAAENDYHPVQDLYDDDTFAQGAIQVVTTGADADLLILQTEMSLQARTERQVLMATTGEVDAKAVSDVQTFIAQRGPLSFVTGNDDHEKAASSASRDYSKEHPTFSFFNGWFSGNTTSVSDNNFV